MNNLVNSNKFLFLIVLMLFVSIRFGAVQQAEAHAVTDVGDYSIIVGWEVEPALVGERNVMYIDLLFQGQLVSAQASNLNLQLLFDGQLKKVVPTQNPETGRYRVTFIPTVSGEYAFQINGTIEEQVIDVVVTPERVEEPHALQFPEIALSNIELQNVIASQQEANAQSNTLVTVALVSSVVSLLVAVGAVAYAARNRPR